MYVDEALALLRRCASELGYSCEETSITESRVDCTYSFNNVNIKVWYAKDKGYFGFFMLQGGQKTYGNIEDFKEKVHLYMGINAVLIPTAKVVADKFEKTLGVNSVYRNFKGSRENGFICYFSILNNENSGISVTSVDDDHYLAQYVIADEEGSHIKAKKLYFVDDAGNVYAQLTIDDYISVLYERYANSETINIRRYEECSFEFDITGVLHINTSVEIDGGTKFVYVVHSVIDKSGTELIEDGDVRVDFEDIYSIETLADHFSKTTEETLEESEDDFEYDDDEDDIFDTMSGMREIIDEKKPKLSGLEEELANEEDEFFEEEVVEDAEPAEEVEDTVESEEVSESTEEVSEVEEIEDEIEEVSETEEIEEETTDSNEDVSEEVEEVEEENSKLEISEEIVDSNKEIEDNSSPDKEDITEEEEVDEMVGGVTKVVEQETFRVSEEVTPIKEDLVEEKPAGVSVKVSAQASVAVGVSSKPDEGLLEVRLITSANEIVGVRFDYSNKLFDISMDKARELGLPIEMIQRSVERKSVRGMLITDEELSRRIFAQNISNNADLCSKVIEDLFS